jgi:hypothetical protein
MKDLENELLRGEIDQYTVQAAFAGYLDKLDGVAQLEIAGFYHEDDGDNANLHVFGRTEGAEPHVYYYRRFDYRQWTPWEKVDLDIQGDYLIPAVVSRRLFLFWPIFSDVPDDSANSTVTIPKSPGGTTSKFTPDKTTKKLKLQMAVSDYRQGTWTPKRVSTQFAESASYTGEIVRKHYAFFPIDRSDVDGRFGVVFNGASVVSQGPDAGTDGKSQAALSGAFEIAGARACRNW